MPGPRSYTLVNKAKTTANISDHVHICSFYDSMSLVSPLCQCLSWVAGSNSKAGGRCDLGDNSVHKPCETKHKSSPALTKSKTEPCNSRKSNIQVSGCYSNPRSFDPWVGHSAHLATVQGWFRTVNQATKSLKREASEDRPGQGSWMI